jgi:hypothetical protein
MLKTIHVKKCSVEISCILSNGAGEESLREKEKIFKNNAGCEASINRVL